MNKRLRRISKYLTYILRHEPHSIGLKLDEEGYLPIDELVEKANASGKTITADLIQQVLTRQDPPLFALSDDGTRIRARTL